MNPNDFLPKCKELVANYTNQHVGVTDVVNPEDVYVVWYAKTLQNAKALLSTPVSDGMYYEATYNGNTKEIYFDAYKKVSNHAIDVKGEV